MNIKVLLLGILLINQFSLFSQTGYLDTTFNQNGTERGIASIDHGSSEDGKAMIVDNIGRIYVAACSTNSNIKYVTRIFPNGTIDSTYGVNGTCSIYLSDYSSVTCMTLQKDGKLLIGGMIHLSSAQDFWVARVNNNGTPDSTFDSDGIVSYDYSGVSVQDIVNDIAAYDDGRIILTGQSGNFGFCLRLRTDGTIDLTFNNNIGFVQWNTVAGQPDKGVSLALKGDTIFIGGDFSASAASANYNFSIIKLAPDGTQTGFGKVDFLSSTNDYLVKLLLQPDGRILLAGNSSGQFAAIRVRQNGTIDPTFGAAPTYTFTDYGGTLTSMTLEDNGKILLIGHNYCGGGNCYEVRRLTSTGKLDSTFATTGRLSIYRGSCVTYKSSLSKDKNLLICSGENGNAVVAKIRLRPIIHISGKDYVIPNSTETYEVVVPSSWPYSYKWTFSGSNYYFIPDSIGSKVLLFFNEGATDGVLTCYAHISGSIYGTVELEIKINNNPSSANLLEDVNCSNNITDCYNNYIDHFKLNLISNDSTACNSTGYSDFTRSQWVDTLISGAVYSASVRAESSDAIKYAAIWIDYNNDGSFDSTDEFVSETYGPGPILNVKNIILKNKEGYSGPKRLRVRCNSYGFKATDACPQAGEIGETEDYMIVIIDQDKLAAPEIFTPNEDGKNDFFVIRGVDPEFSNALTVFDRYGEVVFTKSNYENNWDGKTKDGGKVNPGTYYYFFKNDESFIRGFVEIRY